jgi:hypothetical protein
MRTQMAALASRNKSASFLKEMFRLHQTHQSRGGPRPPVLERSAATQKAVEKAPTRRAKEEAERMGDTLAYHKKKETPSIK